MFKKMLILVLALVVCVAGTVDAYAAEDKNLEIELDGKVIEMPGKVWEGELFLPLRAVSEELGYDVEWFGDKREIKMSKPEESINLNLSDYKLDVKGHESYMGGGQRIVDDRTYLRQDFFSDNLGLKVTWDKTYNKVTLQGVGENPIMINTRKEASETDTLKLTIQYPEIEGLNNTEVQNKLNSLFARLASEAKDRGSEMEKDLAQVQIENHIKAEVYFNYQVKYNQKDMLSIVISDYQYSGGAHGITVKSSYTFDLNTGKEYEIKDLFPGGSEYVSTINSAIKKQMEERNMTATLVPFESIKADQDFYLSNSAVVVYFQQYEYYPYAMGIPEFAVDYSLMAGYSQPVTGLAGSAIEEAIVQCYEDTAEPIVIYEQMPFEDGTLVLAEKLTDGEHYPDLHFVDGSGKVTYLTRGSYCWSLNYTQFRGHYIYFGLAGVETRRDAKDPVRIEKVEALFSDKTISVVPREKVLSQINLQEKDTRMFKDPQGYILAAEGRDLPGDFVFTPEGGEKKSISGMHIERNIGNMPDYLKSERPEIYNSFAFTFAPMLAPAEWQKGYIEGEICLEGKTDDRGNRNALFLRPAGHMSLADSFIIPQDIRPLYLSDNYTRTAVFSAGESVAVKYPEGRELMDCRILRLTGEKVEKEIGQDSFAVIDTDKEGQVTLPKEKGYYLFLLRILEDKEIQTYTGMLVID